MERLQQEHGARAFDQRDGHEASDAYAPDNGLVQVLGDIMLQDEAHFDHHDDATKDYKDEHQCPEERQEDRTITAAQDTSQDHIAVEGESSFLNLLKQAEEAITLVKCCMAGRGWNGDGARDRDMNRSNTTSRREN